MYEGKKSYVENPAPERKAHVYTGPDAGIKSDDLKVSEIIVDEFVAGEEVATKQADEAAIALSELVESTECKHLELMSCKGCPEPEGSCALSPAIKMEELIVPVVEKSTPNLVVFNCAQLNLRNSPELGLGIIGVLSCGTELIEIESNTSTEVFVKVCTASGVEGYVNRDYVTKG